jgi:hypothetical protein
MSFVKFLSMRFFLVSMFSLVIHSGKAQCTPFGSSLATPYVSNNSNKGEMFNVVTTNAITVICFDLSLSGSTGNYEIYYKVGSYVGSESNAAAWTLLGSNPSVTPVGSNIPSPINIPINLFMPAGQTYAFYVTGTDLATTTAIRYTNNAGYTNIASDANVTIAGGIGKSYPFGTNFANRSFNGTLHYGPGNVLPVELVSFYATPLDQVVRLNWTTASEKKNDYFTVERSTDGISWTTLQTIKGRGDSEKKTNYELTDEHPLYGISYYRLGQTDVDRKTTHSDIKSIERRITASALEKLEVSPNPANALVTIKGSADELGEVLVTSLLGQDLTKDVKVFREENSISLELSGLENQLLIITCGNRSALVMKQ